MMNFAMMKLCDVLRDNNKGTSHAALAREIGVHRQTITKCMNYESNNPVVAQWVADTYGGSCVSLNEQVKAEVMGDRGGSRLRAIMGDHKTYETHVLPEIDQDDILRLTLPVVHPRPWREAA